MTAIAKKDFFESLAGEWEDRHVRTDEGPALSRLVKAFSLAPGSVILDAGCGTGRLVPYLRTSIGSCGRIIELDFAAEMLRFGRAKADGGLTDFVLAETERLPLKASVFDAVVCFSLFPHLNDPAAAAAECHRVLRPGRSLFIAHLMSRQEVNCFHARTQGPVTMDILPDGRAMRRILGSAGFISVSIIDRPSFYLATAVK